MTTEQKRGYLAAVDNLVRALRDVQRAACITTVGLGQVIAIEDALLSLNSEVRSTRAKAPRPAPAPNPAPLDTRPMRPSRTGD